MEIELKKIKYGYKLTETYWLQVDATGPHHAVASTIVHLVRINK